ncbi:MAG: DnaJ domain-containing protein [Proteobacteria bacterium]|nr:DnaJ domain-containing protein [Pseudomonadota bacterium]
MVSSEEDNFGNYLLKKGLVSTVELGVYKENKQEGADDPRSLFVNMGCLTAEEFRTENRNYLFENISECFSWPGGIFIFQPKTSFFPEPYCTATDMPLIIFKGFKNNLTPARTERFLGKKGALYPRKTRTFFDYQAQLSDIPVAYKTFDMLDGTKSCTDIISSIEIDDETALSMIMTMDVMKMVSYSPSAEKLVITPPFPIREKEITNAAQKGEGAASPADKYEDLGEELGLLSDELEGIETSPQAAGQQVQDAAAGELEEELKSTWERVKGNNYYEIFGLTRHSYSFNSLKSAYFELTKKFSPDKFFASSGEIMDIDQELLSKVTEAYELLSNVVSKENYDEYLESEEAVSMGSDAEDDKMKIQVQFTSGKVFLEEGQFESAEKAFTNLVNMVPDKPEYLSYLALAVYNNPANRVSKTAAPRAKELIMKSLKLGKLSMTYALKGTIVFDEGSLSLAEAEFNKALRINPNNKMATKKMKEISARREQEKKGVLRRMFK